MTRFKRYAFGWITLFMFVLAIAMHWYFGWQTFLDDAKAHHTKPEVSNYVHIMLRGTMEN